MVLELLEGETLPSGLAGKPLPVRKAIDYAVQIAHGLAAAHEKGIVHRDLKPDNLFVTRDGRVKILDFGLAKAGPGSPGRAPTPISHRRGGHQSRRRARHGRLHVPRAGARPVRRPALRHLLLRCRALRDALGPARLRRRHGRRDDVRDPEGRDPPELARSDEPVPPTLERIVRRCLEKDPSQRFRSAHDLAFALEALSGIRPDAGDWARTTAPLVGATPGGRDAAWSSAGCPAHRRLRLAGSRARQPPEVRLPAPDLRRGLLGGRALRSRTRRRSCTSAAWDGRADGALHHTPGEPGVAAPRTFRRPALVGLVQPDGHRQQRGEGALAPGLARRRCARGSSSRASRPPTGLPMASGSRSWRGSAIGSSSLRASPSTSPSRKRDHAVPASCAFRGTDSPSSSQTSLRRLRRWWSWIPGPHARDHADGGGGRGGWPGPRRETRSGSRPRGVGGVALTLHAVDLSGRVRKSAGIPGHVALKDISSRRSRFS